jgi:hypothetical protein
VSQSNAISEDQFRELEARMRENGATEWRMPVTVSPCGVSENKPKTPSHTFGVMNRTEAAYAQELEAYLVSGIVSWYKFEVIKFRLANRTTYTPDFAVFQGGKLTFIEIKGFERDGSGDKFKIAAEMFPFEFKMLRKRPAKAGGGWEVMRHLNKEGYACDGWELVKRMGREGMEAFR